MKKQLIITAAVVASISLSSCGDEETTMPIETVDTVTVVETVIEEPVVTREIDTTRFVERDLEAEFRALVEEKLQTVYFEYNSYELSMESQDNLQTAAEFLKSPASRNSRIKITGHADERGTSQYNMALGEKRAVAVQNYLTRYGIGSDFIEVTSMGNEMPATRGCNTDECHDKNRRAAFSVIN